MLNEIDIVRDVSRRLDEAGILFMLTGSMAMNYYAVPRMTRDIDIVLALDSSRVAEIADIFGPDYLVDRGTVEEAARQRGMFNLIHQESVIKVDCIVRKDTPYRRTEFDRRQRISLTGFQTWIVGKEDLILSKLDWARDSRSERQLDDVRNLLASGCDRSYIEQWAGAIDLLELWKEIAGD